MEYKKDNHPKATQFIGQQNQEQKNNQTPQGYGYIVRKAEKLTTALYLVTDILSEKEPMKWRTRETGVDILSDITVASSAPLSEKLSVLRVVLKKIDKVISFLDIASSTHMMSEMNASMLKNEYVALKTNIETDWERTQEHSKTILSERFFDVREDVILKLEEEPMAKRDNATSPIPGGNTPGVAPRSEVKQEMEKTLETISPSRPVLMHTPRRVEHVMASRTPEVSAERLAPVATMVAPAASPRPVLMDRGVMMRARVDVSRDDRRKIILALIKQKPAITVGDIAKSISGVSEKTIQRELLSMVAENVLIKRGERRWSTYSLRDS